MLELFGVVISHLSVGLDLHPLLLQAAVAMRGLCCGQHGEGFILDGVSMQKCGCKGGSGNETRMCYLSAVIATVLQKYFETCKQISFNYMLACQLKAQEGLFQHNVLCSLSLWQKGKLIWNDQLGLYAAWVWNSQC